MSGRTTTGFRLVASRRMSFRFVSSWVLAALLGEVVIAVLGAALPHASFLISAYLLPVLALALVDSAPRTAGVAVVAFVLSVVSGIWANDFLQGVHVYRVAVVAGGGCLAWVGAELRTQAVAARDRMEVLARVAEIADGSSDLTDALHRLARALVPAVADMSELFLFQGDDPQHAAGVLAPVDNRASPPPARTALPSPAAVIAARQGEALLLRRLGRVAASARDPLNGDAASLLDLGMRSAVLAPVRAADETLALLVLAAGPSGRRFGADDLRFAQTVGSRAALAIQNSHLLADLRETRQRLEAIVGSLADAVTIRDLSGRLIYANAAALRTMDLAPTEDITTHDPVGLYEEFIITDEQGDPLAFDQLPSVRLLKGESPDPLVLRYVHPSVGTEHWRVLKATPLYDADGNLDAAVTIIEDITPSKQAERRSALLSRASEILSSSLDYEATLANVAWLAVPEVADWCSVELFDEQGQRQRVVTAHRDPAKLELARRLRELQADHIDPDRGLGAVMSTGQAQLIREIPPGMLERSARSPEHLALMREVQARSGLVVPMRGADRMIGAMTLVNAESGRVFDHGDLSFAEQLVARAAVAVENSRLYSERARIASTLQHSLLPDALPEIPGWEVAALYRPASVDGAVEVGGDFYDAFETRAGWLMLIGDVTGKGVEAAAMTSLVRHGARFVAEYAPDPAEVLARIDHSLRQQVALSLCTALCLLITEDRIVFASAGHPLPLVLTDDGVRTVGEAGPVLGAFGDGSWPLHELELENEDVMLLYTDGVTDTVGREERFGEDRLSDTMAECGPQAPDELLACLDHALSRFQVGPQADDTAALALRLAGQPVRTVGASSRFQAGG